jgi:hypothetical protein
MEFEIAAILTEGGFADKGFPGITSAPGSASRSRSGER